MKLQIETRYAIVDLKNLADFSFWTKFREVFYCVNFNSTVERYFILASFALRFSTKYLTWMNSLQLTENIVKRCSSRLKKVKKVVSQEDDISKLHYVYSFCRWSLHLINVPTVSS